MELGASCVARLCFACRLLPLDCPAWPVQRGLRSWRNSLLHENVKAMLGVVCWALCSVCVLIRRWRWALNEADNLETWAMLGASCGAMWRWLWPLRCIEHSDVLALLLIGCRIISDVLALLCFKGCVRSFRDCVVLVFVRAGLL